MIRFAKAAAVVCLAALPASADSANVEVKAHVQAACTFSASIVEIKGSHLILHATVQRNCNAAHSVSVTYQPAVLTNPSSLEMVFDGMLPTSTAPGIVTFAGLPIAASSDLLTIEYSGPPGERESIKTTVAVQVTVP